MLAAAGSVAGVTRTDATGLAFAAGLSGWLLLSAAANPGSHPLPALALLLAAVVVYVAGRLLGRVPSARSGLPLLVAAGVASAILLTPDGLSGGPLAGPLGYGNANGALGLLGVGAAVLAGVPDGSQVRRSVAGFFALLDAGLTVATGSKAAAALAGLLVVAGVLLAARPGTGKTLQVVAVLVPSAAFVVTVLLGGSYTPGTPRDSAFDRVVDAGLTERRVVLWSQALELGRQAPFVGVGPGQFAVTAPLALRDRDARWAHSLPLQQVAETGLPGVLLLGGLLASAWAALGRTGRDRRRVVGALLLGAVLTQATQDYVAHFAAVPLLLALLVGLAQGRRRRRPQVTSAARARALTG